MRIRADEHISLEIVSAIEKIALGPGFEITSVLTSGDRGAEDVHWATRFAAEGGQVVFSADTDFLRRHHLLMAIYDAGLIVVHLPSKWANARRHMQAAHVLQWWPRIERGLVEAKPRDCITPPWTIGEEGKLQKVTINYEEARKRVKKAERPSRTQVSGARSAA